MESGYRHISHGFDPVFNGSSHVLVLGSFPSVLSRANRFYYGNPRNRFWTVMAAVLGVPVPPNEPIDASIAAKKALLLDGGIALWDVVASCDIKGSSDASIRNVRANDIGRVLSAAPVEAVFANGRAAETLYRAHVEAAVGMPIAGLPSTSPANAAWRTDRLVAEWGKALAPHLGRPVRIPKGVL